MYMRYLGGGVGHRGIGVSLDASRAHASRSNQKPSHKVAGEERDSGSEDDLEDVNEGDEPHREDLENEAGEQKTGSQEDGEDGEEDDEEAEEDIDHGGQSDDDSESGFDGDESDGADRDDGHESADQEEDELRDTVYADEGFLPL